MSQLLKATTDELRESFMALETPRDVASILDVPYHRLVYHLYKVDDNEKYTQFSLAKATGGERTISAPATALKLIQKKLNQVLQAVYAPKPSAHCRTGRSIITNARQHANKRYVLNLDLKSFFPSINFGRVRGMFMAIPYKRPPEVATVLAQIACHDNQLPQGAPTSTVISNMLCAKMDAHLQRLAKRSRSTYTRYVDDITFSTTLKHFPEQLAQVDYESDPPELVGLSPPLTSIIDENGFTIHPGKVRLQLENQHQEVTGLTVNEFPNVDRKFVRQIRAMLHAWRKYGLEAAERDFKEKHDDRAQNRNGAPPSFYDVLQGKLEFLGAVKGKNNSVYRKYQRQFDVLADRSAD
jgi:RNA-directed DNA polymerase